MPVNQNLENCIAAFVKHADKICEDHWKTAGYTFSKPNLHQAHINGKWAKVYTLEDRDGIYTQTSIYAFIALQDFNTKTLGQIKTGDIHKPASYLAPAKHRRGSVFASDFDNCAGPYGIVYLR